MSTVTTFKKRETAADLVDQVNHTLSVTTDVVGRIDIIRNSLPGRIAFSTSLGLEDQVLLHAIAASRTDIDLFTLDTGRHFHETLETIAASEQRYGIKIRVVVPDRDDTETLVERDGLFGFRSSMAARKACCDVRKVRPLQRSLAGAGGWITGLRRSQSSGRNTIPFAEIDPAFNLIKVNPLADWTLEDVETFIAANDVPVNALHARDYPSIGCAPCTRAVRPGEDIRAGRWWWESPDSKECGLHTAKALTADRRG